MVNTARDEFLRRYATSPIHVPRLERLLAVYGSGEEDDAFCSRFIAWDRACRDGEAARIVTEILSAGDASGRIAKYSEDAVRGAIRWMSDVTWVPVWERARLLKNRLTGAGEPAVGAFIEFLAAADRLEDAQFRAGAEPWVDPLPVASGHGS
jgi:hypothetical protein